MERETKHSGDADDSDEPARETPPEAEGAGETAEDEAAGPHDPHRDKGGGAGVPDDPDQATGHPDNAG